MSKISVQSMIKNEMDLLPRYYNFVKEFADEWVILDACSTDGSVEFLSKVQKKSNLKIVLDSDKKYDLKVCKDFNYLLEESRQMCSGDFVWLGYLDEFTPLLKNSRDAMVKNKINGLFKRYNMISLNPFLCTSSETVLRLYPKEDSVWKGKSIHSEYLENKYVSMFIDGVNIYHIGEARDISHIVSKEEGFEACGKSVLTSKFSEEERLSKPKHPLPNIEVKDILYTEPVVHVMDSHKILAYRDRLDKIRFGYGVPPVMMEIFPSGVCNHKCEWCLFAECREPKFLSYTKIHETLKSMRGVTKSLDLCGGGEPTLHPKFKDILEDAYIYGYKIGVITNGSTLKKYYKELANYCTYVRVSLDAINELQHYNIHRSKDFVDILEGVKMMVEERNRISNPVNIGLKFTLGKKNMFDVISMTRLGYSLYVDNVQFKPAVNTDQSIPLEIVDEVQKTIEVSKMIVPNFVYGGVNRTVNTHNCLTNWLSAFIDESGNVAICCYYQGRQQQHTLGNICKDSFKNIWYSSNHLQKVAEIDNNVCNKFMCRFHKYNDVLNKYYNEGDVNFI